MWCAVSPTSWRVAHSSLAVRLFVTLHSGHSAGGWELMNFRARLFGRRWLDVRGRRGHAGNMCLSADANKERWVSGQVRSLGGVVRVRVRFRLEGAVPIGGGGACERWPQAGHGLSVQLAEAWPPRTARTHSGGRLPPSHTPWHPAPNALSPVQSYLNCTALAARAAHKVHSFLCRALRLHALRCSRQRRLSYPIP